MPFRTALPYVPFAFRTVQSVAADVEALEMEKPLAINTPLTLKLTLEPDRHLLLPRVEVNRILNFPFKRSIAFRTLSLLFLTNLKLDVFPHLYELTKT